MLIAARRRSEPPLRARFRTHVDLAMERAGLLYVRFMDDILVLAPTGWHLRRAVKAVNQTLAAPSLEKHVDKTFTGKIGPASISSAIISD
jgi:hypothetical protein